MTLVSSSIPNFVNGVSQQPFTQRLTSQGEVQENGYSTVSSGLRKRSPTEHVAKISNSPLDDCVIHTIDRDGTEQYQLVVTNGDLRVFGIDGVERTVNFTNKAYLNTTGAVNASFALTTVADYTFITNRTITTAQRSDVSPARPFEALFNIKLGNYGKTYEVIVNGTSIASFATPTGSDAAQSPQISTDYIAAQLASAMTTAGYNSGSWAMSQFGSSIYLKNTSTDFTVATKDGFNSFALVAIKDNLQKFTDLPANPMIDSFQVEIVGDQTSAFDNYWVKFDAGGTNNTAGVWKESMAPGMPLGLDGTTMPHQLVREANGTFTFAPAAWVDRKVGDEGSSPDPSFVGNVINDVFFFQNRLGFLSDENFIMTETGNYFNPYRTTVITLLDSDPVDASAATNKVAVLTHAVSFNKQLLLFSRQQQFIVDSTDIMSPKKVPIKPSTAFFVNTAAKPAAAGRNVYFAVDKGNWSSVREYFADLNNLTNDATDITSHVPTYVPSGIIKIAAGANEDVLAFLSETDRTKLFIYKYYYSASEKLQSSWSTFTFDATGTILNCDFIKSVLYLVISRADGTYLEKIDFSVGASSAGEPWLVGLDRKVQIAKESLTFADGYTTVNPTAVGYSPVSGSYMVVAKGGGSIKAGQIADVDISNGIRIRGDYTTSDLSFGQQYSFTYRLSPLAPRMTTSGGASSADTEGRTQIRKISFNHADTGYYKILVTPLARETRTAVFSGAVVGSPTTVIGSSSLSVGRFTSAVMSQNTTVRISVESAMPHPLALFSADWEGFYVKRSKQI
tara:strand:- start:7503 stop:9875 length:2373 start_codon:yes stop_codon:yes gene_type:complete